jgi:hypothetical protein
MQRAVLLYGTASFVMLLAVAGCSPAAPSSASAPSRQVQTLIGVAPVHLVGNAHPVTAQQDARLALVSGYFDAIGRGDVDEALSAFAESAVFIPARQMGTCSGPTPCTDLASIRQEIEVNVAGHACPTIRWVEVSGSAVFGQYEHRGDSTRANGVERLLRSFFVQIPNDKFTFFAIRNDSTDPQTRLNTNVVEGTQAPRAPLPNPETPCAGV